jgi:acetyl esterase
MPLDLHARQLIERFTDPAAPPVEELPLEEVRSNVLARFTDTDGAPQAVRRVVNTTCPGPAGDIPLRLYYPEAEGVLPATIYFHGGGWVVCNLESHDTTCRRLANAAGCLVVSVDYRLAPEQPFPAAVDDSYAATMWVARNSASLGADAGRIAVAGDSAGGNLATVVALLSRDAGGPKLVFQLLVVPVTEYLPENASYRENGEGYFLTRNFMAWFFSHYLKREEDKRDWRAFPSLAGSLAGLPPALVLTAEYDPLRDEGEAYARQLSAAGVSVQQHRFEGTIHQFFVMSEALPQGRTAMKLAAGCLRRAFQQETAACLADNENK